MGEDIFERQEKLQAYLQKTPFAEFLGFRCEVMGDEMTAILPFEEKLIGNGTIRGRRRQRTCMHGQPSPNRGAVLPMSTPRPGSQNARVRSRLCQRISCLRASDRGRLQVSTQSVEI